MSSSKDILLNALSGAENVIDKSKFFIKRKLGALGPFTILPYYGYGNHETLYIMGRLLEDEGVERPDEDAPAWRNMITMFNRYKSDELPNARLKASFKDQTKEVETDSEGYFHVEFNTNDKLSSGEIWQEIHFELIDQIIEDQGEVKSVGEVMVPNDSTQYGVISDVDDTILVSKSTDTIQKGKLTFLQNAKTRMPFKGVSAFYSALQAGSDGNHFNPIFYVSSSPWNLFDLLVHFCEVNEIPKGPFLLRDMGINKDKFIKSGHMDHKINKITNVFKMYPELPFILMGDSGQKDAEIYQKIVSDYPDKVLAIYIRDVSPENKTERDKTVKDIAQTVRSHGIDMLLCQDTEDAAHHAIQKGFIPNSSLKSIIKGKQEDESRDEE